MKAIDKTIITKGNGTIIIPRKIIKREIPNNSSNNNQSSSDVIKIVPQELTEEQQMQARLNQGLYAEDVIPGGEIAWDGNTTDKEQVDIDGVTFYKIANSPTNITSENVNKVIIAADSDFDEEYQQSFEPEYIEEHGYLKGAYEDNGEIYVSAYTSYEIDSEVGSSYMIPENVLIINENGVFARDIFRSLEYLEQSEIKNKIDKKYIKDFDEILGKKVDKEEDIYDFDDFVEDNRNLTGIEYDKLLTSNFIIDLCKIKSKINVPDSGGDSFKADSNIVNIFRNQYNNSSRILNLISYFKLHQDYEKWIIFIDCKTRNYNFVISELQLEGKTIDGTNNNGISFELWKGDTTPDGQGHLNFTAGKIYKLEIELIGKYLIGTCNCIN